MTGKLIYRNRFLFKLGIKFNAFAEKAFENLRSLSINKKIKQQNAHAKWHKLMDNIIAVKRN